MGLASVLILFLAMATAVPTVGPSAAPSAAPVAGPVAPAASPASTTTPATAWLGVSLGQSSKDVRSELGRPREIIPTSIGDMWRYDADAGNVSLELILDQDQVVSIAASPKAGKQSTLSDPTGGALGMTATSLQTARGMPIATYDNGDVAYGDPAGVRWFYTIDGGVVTRISMSAPLPSAPPAQVISDAAHDGSSAAKAFIVKASTQTDAANAELGFFKTMPCDDGGAWQIVDQELVTAGGGFFDLFHVSCSTNKQLHDFYFDVTQSYAHL
jgi:hypothetical protein